MESNTVILGGLEFHFRGERTVRPGGLARFIIREYIAWEGVGDDARPTDRFEVFRSSTAEPWTAWCCDTLSAEKRERRRALARHLNMLDREQATARRDAALAADGRDHSARAVLARLPVINDPVISEVIRGLDGD